VILGILAVWVFGLDEKGVKIVGHIDSGLPALGLASGVGWRDYLSLFGPAIGVLLIGFAEGFGSGQDVRNQGRL
jgi:SulP family sulfate permease